MRGNSMVDLVGSMVNDTLSFGLVNAYVPNGEEALGPFHVAHGRQVHFILPCNKNMQLRGFTRGGKRLCTRPTPVGKNAERFAFLVQSQAKLVVAVFDVLKARHTDNVDLMGAILEKLEADIITMHKMFPIDFDHRRFEQLVQVARQETSTKEAFEASSGGSLCQSECLSISAQSPFSVLPKQTMWWFDPTSPNLPTPPPSPPPLCDERLTSLCEADFFGVQGTFSADRGAGEFSASHFYRSSDDDNDEGVPTLTQRVKRTFEQDKGDCKRMCLNDLF